MGILFADGFDHGTRIAGYTIFTPTGSAPSTSYGRNGGYGVRVGDNAAGWIQPVAQNCTGNTRWIGMACYIDAIGNNQRWFRFTNVGAVIETRWRSDGSIELRDFGDGNADYVSDIGAVPIDQWFWFEIELTFDAVGTTGSAKMWVDGVQVMNVTGITTDDAPPDPWSPQIGGTSSDDADLWWVDDFMIGDGDGITYPIGDCTIETLVPDGNGNSSGLTGSDGNSTDNYQLVDEVPPSDSDYVGSDTEGDKDTYSIENVPTSDVDILGVSVCARAAKTDAGDKYLRPLLRVGGTDYAGTSVLVPNTTYQGVVNELWEENPDTSSAWTASAVNGIEAGVEVRDS